MLCRGSRQMKHKLFHYSLDIDSMETPSKSAPAPSVSTPSANANASTAGKPENPPPAKSVLELLEEDDEFEVTEIVFVYFPMILGFPSSTCRSLKELLGKTMPPQEMMVNYGRMIGKTTISRTILCSNFVLKSRASHRPPVKQSPTFMSPPILHSPPSFL